VIALWGAVSGVPSSEEQEHGMKSLFRQSEDEKRASIAAVNLFFSVVLGANLGSINSLDLYDYFMLLLLLSGSVIAIFTIAVSQRTTIVLTTLAVYGGVLGGMLIFPELRPDQMEGEIVRIILTLAVWVALLITFKLLPVAGEAAFGAPPIEERDEVADLLVGPGRSVPPA
jgi:hypothetical protein